MKRYLFLEKRILQKIKRSRLRIYFFIVVSVVLWNIPLVPYANVVITYQLSILLIILIFLFLFRVSFKIILSLVTFLFLVCLFFQLVNQLDKAEILANYVYGILMLEVIMYLVKPYDKKN